MNHIASLLFLALSSLSLASGRNDLSSSPSSSVELSIAKVDPHITSQTWEGWGISLAWWTKMFGDRDDLADAMFSSQETVKVWGRYNIPGLGLNSVRYNAGGSAWRKFDGKSMVTSPHIPGYKQIEGYWQDSHSDDVNSASWDWSVDSKQRTAMQKAKERGANKFELFSNSPMWWMLKNHNPSGSSSGTEDNLDDLQYDNFAKYLANIAAHAQEHWGITFDSVEPMNEPGTGWWNANGNQEGCHFTRGFAQTRIVKALRSELDKRNVTAIVAASDENSVGLALESLAAMVPLGASSSIGGVNTHGYIPAGESKSVEIAVRIGLAAAAAGKRLWNTEYGDHDSSGKTMAGEISMDMTLLRATAWHYWQAVDGSGWGLLKLGSHNDIVGVNQKYWVLAHHTRHIRAGMSIIESGQNNTITAYDGQRSRLVIVTTNHWAERQLQFDLSRFSMVAGPISKWSTQFYGEQRYAKVQENLVIDTLSTQKQLTVMLPAESIHTIEIENVQMAEVVLV